MIALIPLIPALVGEVFFATVLLNSMAAAGTPTEVAALLFPVASGFVAMLFAVKTTRSKSAPEGLASYLLTKIGASLISIPVMTLKGFEFMPMGIFVMALYATLAGFFFYGIQIAARRLLR